MVLTVDKAKLGQYSQKEPEKFGKLKQKALDLGISTEELITKVADSISNEQPQQAQTQPNQDISDLKDSIQQLTNKVNNIQQQPQPQPTPPPASPFGAMTEFANALKGMKELENTMISGYETLLHRAEARALESVGSGDEGGEGESAEDYTQKKVIDILANKFNIGGGQQQAQAPAVQPNSAPVAETDAIQGGGQMPLTRKEIDEYLQQIPKQAKDGVKSGKISLTDATAYIRDTARKQGVPPPPDEHIEQIFNEVKNGTADTGSSGASLAADNEGNQNSSNGRPKVSPKTKVAKRKH